MTGAPITDPRDRRAYVLGGDAKVTLVSRRTGARFTYRVRGKETDKGALHFVSVLVGPDNQQDYEYLGTIFELRNYRHGKKSRISPDAPSARAFAWAWETGFEDPKLEVWHSGRCSRCHRELTDPESLQRGLGPVCAERAFGG